MEDRDAGEPTGAGKRRGQAPANAVQDGSDAGVMSREEFALEYARHSRAFQCVAAAILGTREGAEDVVQEAAAIALGKRKELAEVRSFSAWMTQIVRYTALNWRRGQKRRKHAPLEAALDSIRVEREEHAAGVVDSRGGLVVDQAGFDDRVLRALRSLSDTARACLLLRVVLDMPYKEIALTLGIPEGTAMTHVARARRALFERLASDAIGSDREGDVS